MDESMERTDSVEYGKQFDKQSVLEEHLRYHEGELKTKSSGAGPQPPDHAERRQFLPNPLRRLPIKLTKPASRPNSCYGLLCLPRAALLPQAHD
jgi:hypothetical protein